MLSNVLEWPRPVKRLVVVENHVAIGGLANDIKAVVTKNFDNIHADKRLVFGYNNTAGGGRLDLLVSHTSSLGYS